MYWIARVTWKINENDEEKNEKSNYNLDTWTVFDGQKFFFLSFLQMIDKATSNKTRVKNWRKKIIVMSLSTYPIDVQCTYNEKNGKKIRCTLSLAEVSIGFFVVCMCVNTYKNWIKWIKCVIYDYGPYREIA